MKQKAYGTLASSEMHTESVDQLVSLPWRVKVQRHFAEEICTSPNMLYVRHTCSMYVRTELQLRFAWCMTGLKIGE